MGACPCVTCMCARFFPGLPRSNRESPRGWQAGVLWSACQHREILPENQQLSGAPTHNSPAYSHKERHERSLSQRLQLTSILRVYRWKIKRKSTNIVLERCSVEMCCQNSLSVPWHWSHKSLELHWRDGTAFLAVLAPTPHDEPCYLSVIWQRSKELRVMPGILGFFQTSSATINVQLRSGYCQKVSAGEVSPPPLIFKQKLHSIEVIIPPCSPSLLLVKDPLSPASVFFIHWEILS